MPPITHFFKEIAGIPVHYDRPPLAQYGSKGVPYKFYCDKDFQEKLDAAFAELFALAGLPDAEVIISAGAHVNKSGYHGLGRAFDLDGIFWKSRSFITFNYPTDKVFYLGLEAVLRKHFGTVLNYLYNQAHHDHLHIDDGSAVGFNASSRSRVLFVQAAITHVLEIPVVIDGVYGADTEAAINHALQVFGISGIISSKAVWLDFLSHIARTAFDKEAAREGQKLGPSQLLSDLLDMVDHYLEDHPSKKALESGIMAFANHEQVKKAWEK